MRTNMSHSNDFYAERLAGIHMAPHERLRAEAHLRRAEAFADFRERLNAPGSRKPRKGQLKKSGLPRLDSYAAERPDAQHPRAAGQRARGFRGGEEDPAADDAPHDEERGGEEPEFAPEGSGHRMIRSRCGSPGVMRAECASM